MSENAVRRVIAAGIDLADRQAQQQFGRIFDGGDRPNVEAAGRDRRGDVVVQSEVHAISTMNRAGPDSREIGLH